jgi:glyceraldehyde 3-phosphate dehydrogenase
MKGILQVVRDPLVSIDFKGSPLSSSRGLRIHQRLRQHGQVVTWYDNEWGYSSRVADLIDFMAKKGI